MTKSFLIRIVVLYIGVIVNISVGLVDMNKDIIIDLSF